MWNDFPHADGLEAASPFKKAANFLCYLCAERCISGQFEQSAVGPEIAKIANHASPICGLEIAIEALHGATLDTREGPKILENRIWLSDHSYADIIGMLAQPVTPRDHFWVIAVLLEQMAYKENPECQYDYANR